MDAQDTQGDGAPQRAAADTLSGAGAGGAFGWDWDNPPSEFGRYRVLEVVHRGLSIVLKAEQGQPRRLVALKIPQGGRLMTDQARARFLREVACASALDHAGVVPILECGDVNGTPYYTMPWVEGRTLDRELVETAAGLDRRLDLFLRLCDVVDALHREGLTHRDLKPQNLLVDRHGDVRLLDFGLAKAMREDSPSLTTVGTLYGTLPYMAPEQTGTTSFGDVTARSDVYALGSILFELLTERLPYDVPQDAWEAVEVIRTVQPPAPSAVNPAIDPAFDAVVARCLAKRPDARYTDAGAVAEAVRGAMQAALRPRQRGAHGMRAALWLVGAVALAGLSVAYWRSGGDDAGPPVDPVLAPEPGEARPVGGAVRKPEESEGGGGSAGDGLEELGTGGPMPSPEILPDTVPPDPGHTRPPGTGEPRVFREVRVVMPDWVGGERATMEAALRTVTDELAESYVGQDVGACVLVPAPAVEGEEGAEDAEQEVRWRQGAAWIVCTLEPQRPQIVYLTSGVEIVFEFRLGGRTWSRAVIVPRGGVEILNAIPPADAVAPAVVEPAPAEADVEDVPGPPMEPDASAGEGAGEAGDAPAAPGDEDAPEAPAAGDEAPKEPVEPQRRPLHPDELPFGPPPPAGEREGGGDSGWFRLGPVSR